jgi:hypothetical protein
MLAMMRCAGLIASMTALLGACSLSTDLSGFSSGAEPARDLDPTIGAGPDAAPTAPPGTTDAGLGGNDGAVTPARYCASVTADFCEDLDGPNLGLGGAWALSGVKNATHGVDGPAASSLPRSIWAETQLLGSGDSAYSYRYVRLGSVAGILEYAFDVRLETKGSGALVVAGVGLEDDRGGYLAEVALGGATDSVRETRTLGATESSEHRWSSSVKVGAWTRIKLELIQLGTSGWGMTVRMNDAIVLSGASLPLWTAQPGARVVVTAGAVGLQGPSAPWRARIDNITLRGAK